MKSLRQLSLPVLAVAALATACNPFTPRNTPAATPTQYPEDPRFAEFVYKSDETPTVKGRTDSVNIRWPNAKASEAHVVVEASPALAFIPAQDPEFWLTAVATVPDETIDLLAEGTAADTLLPGIHQACTGMCRRSASSPPLPRPSRTRRSHQIRRRFHTISAPWTYKR